MSILVVFSCLLFLLSLQQIVMFLDELSEHPVNIEHKPKKAKKQYPAGFKNYHVPTSTLDTDSPAFSEDDLLFEQLKIGNLRELYLQSLPSDNKEFKEKVESQKRSIAHLTTVQKKAQECETNELADSASDRAAQQQRFLKTYHKVDEYEVKAVKKLFKSEFEKMRAKVNEIYKKKEVHSSLEIVIAGFLVHRLSAYLIKDRVTNDQLLLDLTNFINRRSFQGKGESISIQDLREVALKNIFFFTILDLQKAQGRYLNQHQLSAAIKMLGRAQAQIDLQIMEKLLNKKITVPYESQPRPVSNQYRSLLIEPPQDKPQEDYKFHATAIPKSTYDKPTQRPKSQASKTQPQPFNLTVTHSKMPKMEELYCWDRNVHPRQIPKTTYRPQQIKLMSQEQKKKRALGLLKDAEYPSTMKYLNNYPEELQRKKAELEQKYTKDRKMQEIRSVPNFEAIHRRHLERSDEMIYQKRELTRPQPFNLSQPRQKKEPLSIPVVEEEQEVVLAKKIKNAFQEPKVKPASTLKYDSYVEHLKKKKEQKIEKEEKKKKEEEKEDKKQFKEILKNRVYCELGKTPKNNVYSQQPIPSNTVKVNLQNIYNAEPLLMEREAAKSKKSRQVPEKSWQPII